MANLWFFFSNFIFLWPIVLKFLQNILNHKTQVKFDFGYNHDIVLYGTVKFDFGYNHDIVF